MEFTHQATAVRAALATKHGKEAQVGPALAQLGWELSVAAVDTDRLGTFSGLVPRQLSPLEAARRKALMAAEVEPHAHWLVATEGSVETVAFGLVRDLELVVAVEASSGLLVVGRASSFDLHAVGELLEPGTSEAQVLAICERADLPHHRLIAADEPRRRAIGNLAETEEVLAAWRELSAGGGSVHLETDLRAHLCPSRQATIAAAAGDLAARLANPCPACRRPGYGPEDAERGLPCRSCGRPTDEVVAYRLACASCAHGERRGVELDGADPASCLSCNP